MSARSVPDPREFCGGRSRSALRPSGRLVDPAQPQIQRLALQVQGPRGLGLARARRQVGLERLQQRARARRRVGQQRAELLLDERVELG